MNFFFKIWCFLFGHKFINKQKVCFKGGIYISRVNYFKQCKCCKKTISLTRNQFYNLSTDPKNNNMAILSIINQPANNAIKAAYRPIIISCTAEQDDPIAGRFIPPVVFCDVYFNGIYYKSLASTQPTNKPEYGTTNAEYSFDIQGLCQEVHQKVLAQNGVSAIQPASGIILSVYCKLRSSTVNANGFTIPQSPIPVQGTGYNIPVGGGGTQTNTFYSCNSTLQHEDNMLFEDHLNAYKKRIWQSTAFPLTHRPDGYSICKNDADVFPIINAGTKDFKCIKINYRLKNSNEFISAQNCGLIPCVPVGYAASLPNAVKDVPYSATITLTGSAPFTIDSSTLPTWASHSLIGSSITITGTPTVTDVEDDVPIEFEISNECGSVSISETIDVLADAPACTPVAYSTTLPDGQVGIPYSHTSSFTGDLPVLMTSIIKPSWMTIIQTGSDINYSGTPDVGGDDITVSFTLSNCSGGSTLNFSDTIDVLAIESYLDLEEYQDSGYGAVTDVCTLVLHFTRTIEATNAATTDSITVKATFHVIADNGCEADYEVTFNPTDQIVTETHTLTCGAGGCSAVTSMVCTAIVVI